MKKGGSSTVQQRVRDANISETASEGTTTLQQRSPMTANDRAHMGETSTSQMSPITYHNMQPLGQDPAGTKVLYDPMFNGYDYGRL
ncbi:hypothetical protein PENTCL1PPCAC_9626, partial [Pristionchus entomophagus]